ncbi:MULTISPECIES: hypothetical protein [Stenotrophomonas]|nr:MULTISPECIES: hypothetical protein [Stenotrophomonas]
MNIKHEFVGMEQEVGYTQSIDMQAGLPAVVLLAAIWVYAAS